MKKLSELGERGAIRLISNILSRGDVAVGIGDDCALVKIGKEKFLLKSDLSLEGIHFKKRSMSYKDIARRAVGRVLSDFAACGGVPKFIGISLGKPKGVCGRALKDMIKGVNEMAAKYKFSLVGGDASISSRMILDVWGVGITKKFITRSGAKVKDVIFLLYKANEIFPGDVKYLDAAKRACTFLKDIQGNGGSSFQQGWAQQYDNNNQPAWARDFEPPAICSSQTKSSMDCLLEIYLIAILMKMIQLHTVLVSCLLMKWRIFGRDTGLPLGWKMRIM